MTHIEYVCFKCGETYLPQEPGNGHDVREDGSECMGLGYFAGIHWVQISPPELAAIFRAHDPYNFQNMKKRVEHFFDRPDCDDPDCEFHPREVREF